MVALCLWALKVHLMLNASWNPVALELFLGVLHELSINLPHSLAFPYSSLAVLNQSSGKMWQGPLAPLSSVGLGAVGLSSPVLGSLLMPHWLPQPPPRPLLSAAPHSTECCKGAANCRVSIIPTEQSPGAAGCGVNLPCSSLNVDTDTQPAYFS